MLPKFKMAAKDQIHIFVGAKNRKIHVVNYLNFTITFPMIWKCEVLLNFKMAATVHRQNVCMGKNLTVRTYSNSTITFPMIWRCAGDIFKALLKFKMAATNQFHFYGHKNSILQSHSMIWRCAGDIFKILLKFKNVCHGLFSFFYAQKLKYLK